MPIQSDSERAGVKPQGKITLVPDLDKCEAIQQIFAEKDFHD